MRILFSVASIDDRATGLVAECQGAIDIDKIRLEITKAIKGGGEAFRVRKEKYGFKMALVI